MIDAIGIDADDTLWHNEVIFEETHARYCELLSRYHDAQTVLPDRIDRRTTEPDCQASDSALKKGR